MVHLAQGAEHGFADRVHQRVLSGVPNGPSRPFVVRDFTPPMMTCGPVTIVES